MTTGGDYWVTGDTPRWWRATRAPSPSRTGPWRGTSAGDEHDNSQGAWPPVCRGQLATSGQLPDTVVGRDGRRLAATRPEPSRTEDDAAPASWVGANLQLSYKRHRFGSRTCARAAEGHRWRKRAPGLEFRAASARAGPSGESLRGRCAVRAVRVLAAALGARPPAGVGARRARYERCGPGHAAACLRTVHQQGAFAPRELHRLNATTRPSATLSPSAHFPVLPVIEPTLLRRFRAGARRASPVAQPVLVIVLSLPPRRSGSAASIKFRPPMLPSPSGCRLGLRNTLSRPPPRSLHVTAR